MSLWLQLAIVCPLVFLAGFADSISGGGGVISVTAMLLSGLPVHMAYGTNKFVMSFGSITAAYKYIRSGNIKLKPMLFSCVFALIGGALGAKLVLLLDEIYVKYILMVLLPLAAVFMFINRNFGSEDLSDTLSPVKVYVWSSVIGLLCGCYDGFFGPGTGVFLTLLFTAVLKFSLLTASGNARVINAASNVAALATYIINGKVFFAIALPAVVFCILGNYIGASLAVKNGARIIKPIAVAVMLLLLVKIAIELFSL